jgi:hypothetical protein
MGGESFSLEESREIALGLAREVDFPADSIYHIAGMEILKGKKNPMELKS